MIQATIAQIQLVLNNLKELALQLLTHDNEIKSFLTTNGTQIMNHDVEIKNLLRLESEAAISRHNAIIQLINSLLNSNENILQAVLNTSTIRNIYSNTQTFTGSTATNSSATIALPGPINPAKSIAFVSQNGFASVGGIIGATDFNVKILNANQILIKRWQAEGSTMSVAAEVNWVVLEFK